MIKKTVSIFLCTVFIINLCLVSLPVYTMAEENMIVDAKFDEKGEGASGGFTLSAKDGVMLRSEVPGKTGKSVISSSQPSGLKQTPVMQTSSQKLSGKFVLETLYMAEDTNFPRQIFYLISSAPVGMLLIGVDEKGNICYNDSAGKQVPFMTYQAGTWVKIQVALNFNNKTMDIYINGKKTMMRVKTKVLDSLIDVTTIRFVHNDTLGLGGKTYMDDIKLYKGSEPIQGDPLPPPLQITQATPIPTPESVTGNTVYTYEDFEEAGVHTPYGWLFNIGNGAVNQAIRTPIFDRAGKVAMLKTVYGLKKQNVNMTYKFSKPLTFGKVVFEAEVMADNLKVTRDLFLISSSNSKAGILVQMTTNGDFASNGVPFMRFKPQQWYKVQAMLDVSTKLLDVYIDGKKVLTQSPIQNADVLLDVMSFQFRESGDNVIGALYVDNVSAYQSNELLTEGQIKKAAPPRLVDDPKRPSKIFDAYDAMREKKKKELIGVTEEESKSEEFAAKIESVTKSAMTNWKSMNKSPDRKYLWDDLYWRRIADQNYYSFQSLRPMAAAYQTPGSELYKNKELLADIISGLDWIYNYKYNDKIPADVTWFAWEIGAPMQLNDIIVMLYHELTADQIANYMAAVAHYMRPTPMTGANQVWVSKVKVYHGMLTKNEPMMIKGRDGLSPVFDFVVKGDGFYEDGSFIQHAIHSYNGGYGISLVAELSGLMNLLGGTPWQISDARQQNIYEWMYNAYIPLVYKGNLMSMTRGRNISREVSTDLGAGTSVMGTLHNLIKIAPPEDAMNFKKIMKYWLVNNPRINVTTSINNKRLLADDSVPAISDPVYYKQFAGMDEAVQFRPKYAFAISMSSNRIANYESISGENLKGWFIKQGMTFLFNDEVNYYNENYWPSIDPYKLPGTTVDTRPREDAEGHDKLGTKDQVGGVNLDDEFGTTCMEVNAYGSTLEAKKSWFMFDDEIVSLGAGITSKDNYPSQTIIDNRMINRNVFTVNGTEKSSDIGWSEEMTDVKWAHLVGLQSGTDIGYYLPTPAKLKALREERIGNWYDINHLSGINKTFKRNFLNIWFDHGTNPQNASYDYVILPGKTKDQTAKYAENPDITVLANNDRVQAVSEKNLGITGAIFWTNETNTIGDITCDKKAAVMTKEKDGELYIAVSDPTQKNQGDITVEIKKPGKVVLDADSGVTVLNVGSTIKVKVNVLGSYGKTYRLKVKLANN